MHILINAQLLNTENSYRGAGVSNYSQQLLRALGQHRSVQNGEHQITALINDTGFQCDGVELIRSSAGLRNPLRRIVWEQTALPGQLRKMNATLVHGLVNVLPLTTRIPGVVTVHDLSFIRMPEKFRTAKRAYLTALCRASVLRARRVIAVSQQTADDLCDFFKLSANKVKVVHNGVSDEFHPFPSERIAAFRRQKQLPNRFLLYVGTLEPRKNLDLLVRSYAQWRKEAAPDQQGTQEDVKLVLAGATGWFYERIFEQVRTLGLQDEVIFAGFVPHHDLPDWYAAAHAFVYPSLFEGFGLPVLEAMACGTPVLCSDTPSLLEVAGDATLVFSAQREDHLTAALHPLINDEARRAELRQRGLARAAHFSWRRCAEETLAVYESVG